MLKITSEMHVDRLVTSQLQLVALHRNLVCKSGSFVEITLEMHVD